MTDKMKFTSMDIAAERRNELKAIFPNVFTETSSANGTVVESIDFEKLKAELGTFSDVFEARRERYGTDWPGKKDCVKIIQQPSLGTLKPKRNESTDFDSAEHLFIEGDNLESLKLLQKSYYGKVKCIYIDPPYNTGKEFIYPDNYTESLDTYLAYAGLADDEGRKFSANTATEGRFHTRWLNMMHPRLFLARNLLSESGSIWISIDDNELQNVLALCNDVFGEQNFVATFIWEKRTTRENRRVFSFNHDYVVCFAKNVERFQEDRNFLPLNDEVLGRYANPDNDSRGDWQSVSLNAQEGHATKSQFYTITTPSGRKLDPPPGRCWSVTEPVFNDLVADNRVWFGVDGNNVPRRKVFLTEARDGLTPHTLWTASEVGTNDSAKKSLIKLFDGLAAFDTPKPVELVQRILQIATNAESSDIVLDFFAGSGTTAHATMLQNELDRGNRRFVMIQLPEPTAEDSDALKAGFTNLADICVERIRRAGQEIKANRNGELELDSKPVPTTSCKVLALGPSNFLAWHGNKTDADESQLARQLELHVDHVSDDATPEEILYELLLKAGFQPTESVENLELAGINVYSISEGSLLICLENEVTRELIDAVAEAEPMQFICLDKAFKGNDQLKANAVQTFAARNQGREKAEQIIFRTV
jgi:adenine-specific DNA-methyltransferase